MGLRNKANTQVGISEKSQPIAISANDPGWKTRGYDLMELLLLDQYTNSVNFKLYMKAYLDELDELLYQTHEVYLGRMLEFAIGRQLDIIGEILQQSRSILLSQDAKKWFGFFPYVDARGLGNLQGIYPPSLVGNPQDTEGYEPGWFKPMHWYPWQYAPLTDEEYRGVLLARGYVCNNRTRDINTTYKVIHLMLGRVPKYIKLIEINPREIVLELENDSTTSNERDLIVELKKWFIPMGVNFTVSLI